MSEDLIKKEEAKEAVCKGCLKDWGICHHHWNCPMLTNLEMLPSADRPQGEWIRTGRTNIYGGIEVQCSNCGDRVMVQHLEDEWYCRHCGCRMKGADDEL